MEKLLVFTLDDILYKDCVLEMVDCFEVKI